MEKYKVKLMSRAARDLDEIYTYIINEFKVIETAEKMADILDNAILSLQEMPYRGAVRKVGNYANRGYRQIFVNNFAIIYRIVEIKKMVIIVTVRYTPSNF